MIRNSIFISLDSFLGGTGGTGGTPQELARTGGTDRWDQCAQGCPRGSAIFHGGPTGPTVRYHQKFENWLQYHRYPRSHPVSRLSCLGMQKRVPEILELRRRLPLNTFKGAVRASFRKPAPRAADVCPAMKPVGKPNAGNRPVLAGLPAHPSTTLRPGDRVPRG
jgi:hypothetical protein